MEILDAWGILKGFQHDLAIDENIERSFRLLSSGLVVGASWGTPCDICCLARKWDGGHHLLRIDQLPNGEAPWLSKKATRFGQ